MSSALDFDLDAVNAMSRDDYFEAYRLALETADAHYPLALELAAVAARPARHCITRHGVRFSVRRG